ncbi:MAG TPA: Ldh family oxidoreductase [Planctomycetaceae bacterium]|nr:Ldh family oxidoreductase [Planctomycetaceae bacterium]
MPDDEAPVARFAADGLQAFTARVLEHFGVLPDDAGRAAEILVLSDLRGIDSHGLARLAAYCELLRAGRINPRPNVAVVRETPGTATVDGDNGLGLVVAPRANEIAMDKADRVGTGWVAVRNTNHYGIAGWYVLEALKRGQIGWAMTNTSRITAPLWGAERMLGTNPIAIAFPGRDEPPIVIDMATTAAAFGKIEMAIRRNAPIPDGWAIDAQGRPTTDPQAMVDGGAMLPLGSDRLRGGHKGYCLGAMVDLLCGPLSGANWGPCTPGFALAHPEPGRRVGLGIGHFFGALRIDAFIDPDEFQRQIDDWIRTFRRTKPAPGTSGPLIPGDPEREAERINRAAGVPLIESVLAELRKLAAEVGIPLPEVL